MSHEKCQHLYKAALDIVIMFRAKLVAFGTGWSQHGEVYVCDEDERQLEFKISFFKWLIEDAGFWCYIERNIG